MHKTVRTIIFVAIAAVIYAQYRKVKIKEAKAKLETLIQK